MEYLIKTCPKCEGELHIPKDLKTCICMYCGETINLTLEMPKEDDFQYADDKNIEEEYQKSIAMIPKLFENYEESMRKFSRDSYTSCFENYAKTGGSILKPAERYYNLSILNRERVISEVTTAIMEVVNKLISEKSKMKQKEVFSQFRFFLPCYTIPMIRFLQFNLSEPLAESVVTAWNNQNPKAAFQKASYEQIQGGFRKKGLCFITTAVCESMNKADDCYELTSFRKFRDSYMLNSQEGKKLVEEYYRIAPSIVTFLNMDSEREEKYEDIWQNYLKKCLEDIEHNRLKSCEKRYIRMVKNLKREYNFFY